MAEPKDKTTTDAEPASEFGADRGEFLPVWPKEKTFTGSILSREVVENVAGLDGRERDVDLYTVVDDNGEKFSIWGSGMLERVLPQHVGHRVRIEDKGLKDAGGGKSLREYDIRCATCTKEGR